jgi:hypothetical protein
MSAFKNIKEIIDYDNIHWIKNLIELKDVDVNEYDFFMEHKKWQITSYYQYLKSTENTKDAIISEFSEEFWQDCGDDIDYIKEIFDNTSEVHESQSFTITLVKINSDEFLKKLIEYTIENGSPDLTLYELLDESDVGDLGEWWYELAEYFDCDIHDFEEILEGVYFDEFGNRISWASFHTWNPLEDRIGFLKKT